MNPDHKNFIENELPHYEPVTYAACYPRRIVPPAGYLNPKYYAIALRGGLEVATSSEMRMLPHLCAMLNSFKHLELGVPTFFVHPEFAQAVAQTKPPEDFKISEIKCPLDAMLFVLPTEFSLKYFGFFVPFISVVRAAKGTYPDCVKLPPLDGTRSPLNPLINEADRLIICFNVVTDTVAPMDYHVVFNMEQNIGSMKTFRFYDATYWEADQFGVDINRPNPQLPSPEQDAEFHNRVNLFALNLMLTLVTRPRLVKQGQMTRKASVKHNRSRDALWSPNTIGWDYQAARHNGAAAGGTHASPRLHWRMGHWHTVLSGPRIDKETKQPLDVNGRIRKLEWFEPVLVNAPEA